MLDINGQELRERDFAQLLCEVIEIRDDAIRIRILNSDQELDVSTTNDEVLGLHASPELTRFENSSPTRIGNSLDADSQADGVKLGAME